MAVATIETKIANPARRGKKMAKRLSAKQLKYFGTKRQKAAARASRKKNRAKPKAHHRPRTKPNRVHWLSKSAAGRPSQRKRKKNAARKVITGYGSTVMNPSGKTNVVFNGKKRKRKAGSAKKAAAKKRTNPGALYALVNPARKKGNKKMAAKRKNHQRKRPAGSHRKAKKMNRTRRRNPGTLGRPGDWLSLGAGAVAGGYAASALPQFVLGASNTGFMGYLAMVASTAILAVVSHMTLKKPMVTYGIIGGGAGALIRRVVGDYTPFGQYLTAAGTSGMGDYLSGFNFPVPQIIGGNGNTSLGTPGQIPVSVAGAGMNAGRALMNV